MQNLRDFKPKGMKTMSIVNRTAEKRYRRASHQPANVSRALRLTDLDTTTWKHGSGVAVQGHCMNWASRSLLSARAKLSSPKWDCRHVHEVSQ